MQKHVHVHRLCMILKYIDIAKLALKILTYTDITSNPNTYTSQLALEILTSTDFTTNLTLVNITVSLR